MMKLRLFALLASTLALSGCAGRFYPDGGTKGDKGDPGLPGSDGKDGLSAYELYLKDHPAYAGDEQEWLDDLTAGLLDAEQDDDINQYSAITGGGAALYNINSNCVELNVKEYYKGNPVTVIMPNAGALAFEKLEKVTVSKYVEEIGALAFYCCENIKELSLGERVTSIGRSAFNGCLSLQKIDFNESISSLGDYCFEFTSIESFTCPSSLKTIPHACFHECSSLQDVVLHDSVEAIGSSAFCRTSLSSIFIPASVQSIGSMAFGQYINHLTIYCEAASKPDGWVSDWAQDSTMVDIVWGASRP